MRGNRRAQRRGTCGFDTSSVLDHWRGHSSKCPSPSSLTKSVYICSSGKSLTRTIQVSDPTSARHNIVGCLVLDQVTFFLRQSSNPTRGGVLSGVSDWFVIFPVSIIGLFDPSTGTGPFASEQVVYVSICRLGAAHDTFINLIPLKPPFIPFLYQLIKGWSVGIPIDAAITLS
jgi:hypothetical protein